MRHRFYALQLATGKKARLIKALDGDTLLGEAGFEWEENESCVLKLAVEDHKIRGWINGVLLFDVEDDHRPLEGGAAAFVLEAGHMMSQAMFVRPIEDRD